MSRRRSQDYAARGGDMYLRVRDMVREFAVVASEAARWVLSGYEIFNSDTGQVEVEGEDGEPVDVFQGLGDYSKPVDGEVEAIVCHVGADPQHPVAVAARNQAARARYVENFGEPDAGTHVVANAAGTARVALLPDGSVEIECDPGAELRVRSRGGTAKKLAFLDELEALRTAFLAHIHPAIDSTSGACTVSPTVTVVAPPAGTSKLKGE